MILFLNQLPFFYKGKKHTLEKIGLGLDKKVQALYPKES